MAPRSLVLTAVALLLLLTYLLIQGAGPEAARHERTLDALRASILNDAALQRDVLRARAGLERNYDPLVRSLENLRRAVDDLRMAGHAAPNDMRAEIDRHVERVADAVDDQEVLVEQFKSRNAILQNSLIFFMHASGRFRPVNGAERDAVMEEIGTLTNAMLRLTADPRGEAAAEVTGSLDRLGRLKIQEDWRANIKDLETHGRLIVATLPRVNDLVQRLLAVPTAERTRALQNVYLDFHAHLVEEANFFRILLYVAALALAGYVGHLFLRLRANARALQERVDFEHLIAAISAQFINLPRDQIDEGINQGLARLAAHMALDRADILLHDSEEDSLRVSHSWHRTGVALNSSPAEKVPAVVLRWGLEGHERRGCVHVPDVERLPAGPERRCLQEYHVRAWLSAPMSYAGNRIGFLTLVAGNDARHWPDDDIALLRMAGEIFATAIERKRIESDREMLEGRLHQAQKLEAVGTLAGGIAHEFNNILGAILGHGEMALAAEPGNRPVLRHVEQIMRAGQRARTVIEQVLTFSRRRERRHRAFSVQPALAEAIELLGASLPATLSMRTQLRAPDAAMRGDSAQLQQVVMNLCTNAAHAMDSRGTIEIALDTIEIAGDLVLSHGNLGAGRYIRLVVSDTGQGIDARTMQRIFEPFFTTKAAGSGTGLGLSTVHGIVTEHHGAINVESAPGVGTTFTAYFPQTEEGAAGEEDVHPSAPPGHGQTVLLVDDEKELVLLGEEMLAALGYEPVGFDNSSVAVATFRADPQRFDLVLTDEVMPNMTGTELAEALHEVRPDLPIVLMTGYTGPVEMERVRAAGVSDVLKKPLLSAAIAQCLARHLH